MMLNITALAVAPFGVLANRKFLRSMTKGLMLRSARLLLISRRGGTLYCRREGSKIFMAGKAALYSVDELFVDG